MSSSVNFSFVFRPNLDLKPSVNVELSLEEDGIKRFKSIGVWTYQLDWFSLEWFTNRKNISIYTLFGRNRPIRFNRRFWLNISSWTVTIKSLPSDHPWSARMKPRVARYKTPWKRIRRIFIGRFGCVLVDVNPDCYNSPFKTRVRSMIPWTLRPRDPRAIFTVLLMQRISFGHIACIKKLEWNTVPHGKNKREVWGI